MSVSSISLVPMGGSSPSHSRAREPGADGKSLFTKTFGMAASAPRASVVGGEADGDLAAMMDLAGLTGGNNDSAAFAARSRGAGEATEFSIESLQDVLAEGGLASWLVSDDDPEEPAELRAEVIGGDILPSYALASPTPRLLDPSAPDYLDQVRRRLIGIGEAWPPARDALDGVLREERARITERMVAQLSREART